VIARRVRIIAVVTADATGIRRPKRRLLPLLQRLKLAKQRLPRRRRHLAPIPVRATSVAIRIAVRAMRASRISAAMPVSGQAIIRASTRARPAARVAAIVRAKAAGLIEVIEIVAAKGDGARISAVSRK
jgi:hypothetical protein